jgi:hypothetical protein
MPHRRVPTELRIEAMSACQLRCPECPTARGETKEPLGLGYLRATDLDALLARYPEVRRVELSNWGEIFLSPELVDVLRVGHERGVALFAGSGANLNKVSDEQADALARYRLRALKCSIDGATQETYAHYRAGGDLDAVLGNIRRINAAKLAHDTRYPLLTWQFIVFDHNAQELEAARALARELDMTFKPKRAWEARTVPDEGAPSRLVQIGGRQPASLAPPARRYCEQLWNAPQINWDGRVLGCCENYWGDFGGGVFDGADLRTLLSSERLQHARAMVLGEAEPQADVPCSSCHVYEHMRETGAFITRRELAAARAQRAASALEARAPRTYLVARELYRRLGGRRLMTRLRRAARNPR